MTATQPTFQTMLRESGIAVRLPSYRFVTASNATPVEFAKVRAAYALTLAGAA